MATWAVLLLAASAEAFQAALRVQAPAPMMQLAMSAADGMYVALILPTQASSPL